MAVGGIIRKVQKIVLVVVVFACCSSCPFRWSSRVFFVCVFVCAQGVIAYVSPRVVVVWCQKQEPARFLVIFVCASSVV
jgi:hypothetical protein